MFERFRQRSHELENLDKGSYTPAEYEGCIVELQRVNRWLGDASTLRGSLLKEVDDAGLRSFSILDVGAGSGELLRVAAQWARETDRESLMIGLELNERSARAIGEESAALPEISGLRGDAFHLPFADKAFDYVMCSLFTHHFGDRQVIELLREMARTARHAIFVIDLNRNPVAYYFYTTIGRLFLHNRLIREDGALSILRSFKPEELQTLGHQAGLTNVSVQKHFPSRLVLRASANGIV
jgi:SAM-dependent methyltransferase